MDTLSDAMQFYMIDLVSITNQSIYVTDIKANQAYVAIVTI